MIYKSSYAKYCIEKVILRTIWILKVEKVEHSLQVVHHKMLRNKLFNTVIHLTDYIPLYLNGYSILVELVIIMIMANMFSVSQW